MQPAENVTAAPEDDQPLPNLVPCNLDAEQFARYDTNADGILDASEMQVLSEDIKRGNFKLKKVAKQPSAYAYGDVKAELKAGNFKLKKASKISPTSETYIAPFAADADSNDAQFTIQPMTNEEIMR